MAQRFLRGDGGAARPATAPLPPPGASPGPRSIFARMKRNRSLLRPKRT